MSTFKNLIVMLVVVFLEGCSKLPIFKRIVPENTKWAINTRLSCNNYLYITKRYPYNSNIINNLNEMTNNGTVIKYTQNDSAKTTLFNITFIVADTINVTNLLVPYRGGYSKEQLANFDRIFICSCEKSLSDTIYFKEHGVKAKDKFVWDYDFLRKYKFYPKKN